MNYSEFTNAIEALKTFRIDPEIECVSFVTRNSAYRGYLRDERGHDADSIILIVECYDAFDTSGAGNDIVFLPLSNLVAIRHDAKALRYERNKEKSK